jgi:potassium efflux system protein
MVRLQLFTMLLTCLSLGVSTAAEDNATSMQSQTAVSEIVIQSKLADLVTDAELKDQTKKKLKQLYQKTLSNLQTATSNENSAQAFQQATKNAPDTIKQTIKQTDRLNAALNKNTFTEQLPDTVQKIEQLLQEEKSNLASLEEKLSDIEQRLQAETDSAPTIRQRIQEAKGLQDDIYTELKQQLAIDEDSVTSQARQWRLESHLQLIRSEIKSLNQELLSQPVRIKQMEAEKEKLAANINWTHERINALERAATQKHHVEVDQARKKAEAILLETDGKHALVLELARSNVDLSSDIYNLLSRLDNLIANTKLVDRQTRQIGEDKQRAKEIIEIGGLSKGLGHLLLQQHYALPGQGELRRKIKELNAEVAETGVSRLLHRQEQKRLRDIRLYVDTVLTGVNEQEYPFLRKDISALAIDRKALLEQAIATDDFHLQKLKELESTRQRLEDAINDHREYLAAHLLWVRSATRSELQALGVPLESTSRIFSRHEWYKVSQVIWYQATHSPVFILLLFIVTALLWSRTRLLETIRAGSEILGKPAEDRFDYSLMVLVASITTVIALPLAVAVTGWQLKDSSISSNFSIAIGNALLVFAVQLFFISTMRNICRPGGLAEAHFRWPASNVSLLRTELLRLSWIYLPAVLIVYITYYLDPLNAGWEIGRIAFLVMVCALAFAFYRLLHPVHGVLHDYITRSKSRALKTSRWPLYTFVVAAPLLLGVLSLMGYLYSSTIQFKLLITTSWLFVGLIILSEMANRWLLVAQNRIVYEASIREDDQDAMSEPVQDTTEIVTELSETDLVSLSDTSLKLLNTSIIIIGFIGLWTIWSDMLPALRVFENITLWHHTAIVDDAEKLLPITLIDLGLALIYGVATIVLAKQLPAILEIILLESTGISPSSRYTVITLTSYLVITVGVILVLNTIGADWSKLQWLVAALSVGIGFGLQEIVANFISGIIILFERPIRVGDFVTVGETNGVVQKIRIRATTIRNMNAQELLVPNKEFITGRLLNWSLTDSTTRLQVTVGIAYGSDVDTAMRLMKDVACKNDDVLDEPRPSVIFQSFGDSALIMILRCFIDSAETRARIVSALNQEINEKFKEAGIIIAFPQRDLHIDTSQLLPVPVEDAPQSKKSKE